MSQPAISIPSEWTLAQAHEYFARYRYTAFPVTDNAGRAVGMLSIDHLKQDVSRALGHELAGQRADRDPALLVGEQEDVGHLLEQPAFGRVGRAAVIDDEGRPIGVISMTDIERAIRAAGLRNGTSGHAGLVPH